MNLSGHTSLERIFLHLEFFSSILKSTPSSAVSTSCRRSDCKTLHISRRSPNLLKIHLQPQTQSPVHEEKSIHTPSLVNSLHFQPLVAQPPQTLDMSSLSLFKQWSYSWTENIKHWEQLKSLASIIQGWLATIYF